VCLRTGNSTDLSILAGLALAQVEPHRNNPSIQQAVRSDQPTALQCKHTFLQQASTQALAVSFSTTVSVTTLYSNTQLCTRNRPTASTWQQHYVQHAGQVPGTTDFLVRGLQGGREASRAP
jgi:hypothetical protein